MRPDLGGVVGRGLALADGLVRLATSLALALLFAVVVVPTSLVLRLTGTRLIEGGPDPGRGGYWCERDPAAADSWRRQW